MRQPGPVQFVRHMLLLGSFVLPVAAGAATLDIALTGIDNDHGLVRVAVCTPETFTTKHCPFSGAVPAQAGDLVIRVEGIPPGRYAVQAYQDEDGNGRVRRGLFGIPSEALGFRATRRCGSARPGSRTLRSISPSRPRRHACGCATSGGEQPTPNFLKDTR